MTYPALFLFCLAVLKPWDCQVLEVTYGMCVRQVSIASCEVAASIIGGLH